MIREDPDLPPETLREAQAPRLLGRPDRELVRLDKSVVRRVRHALDLPPVQERVDTCAQSRGVGRTTSSYDRPAEVAPRRSPG
ncbi:hypothetical protein QJS66_03910 [Kocuria rhizophila]|nr:hypothetical protein QJS66_03910 [Kocuria rhizophila]